MTRSDLRNFVLGVGLPAECEAEDESRGETRPFTSEELERIGELFAYCGCGGTFYPEEHKRARLRCPECKSADVSKGPVDILID
jgi:hypothetical protein